MTVAATDLPMVWKVYRCVNVLCDDFGERWPVRETEEVGEERCPGCGRLGKLDFITSQEAVA